MKVRFVKILCAVLIISMTALTFASCGKKYDAIYLEDDKGDIAVGFNENMVSYHMAMEKTSILRGMGLQEDMPELWTMTIGEYAKALGYEPEPSLKDMSFEEYYNDSAIKNAKRMVAASYLFDRMKGQDTVAGRLLAASDKKLEAQVDNVVSELQVSIGSKDDFESFISGLGITLEDFRKYYEMSFKTTELRKVVDVSEEEKMDYFAKNYSIVKHILINTNSKTNDAGEKVSLTAEEKQAELDKVKQIEARLAAGEEYEVIYAEYEGTDPGTAMYSEGYFVTDNNAFMPEFQNAALTMKEGEVRTVYTSYGAHIMKKYPMDPKKYSLYNDIKTDIESTLSTRAFNSLVNPYIDRVKTDDKILEDYTLSKVSMLNPNAK